MRAIAWGFYAPHHFKINSEVPYCIFVFPPLPLSVAWGCFTDSSSSRIFSLKYGTCVSRKYLLGRVSILVAFFFLLLLMFCLKSFSKKKNLNQIWVQNNRFLFSSPRPIFTSRVKNTWLFWKDISSDKKRSSYLLKVLSVTRKRYMG